MPLQDWGLNPSIDDTDDDNEGGFFANALGNLGGFLSSGIEVENPMLNRPQRHPENSILNGRPNPDKVDIPLLSTPLGDVSLNGETTQNLVKLGGALLVGYFIMKWVSK